MSTKVKKMMTQPINILFNWFKSGSRIQILLVDNPDMRLEGNINSQSSKRSDLFSNLANDSKKGFDEYMNIVLDDAAEIYSDNSAPRKLGKIMLKGDNISLLREAPRRV